LGNIRGSRTAFFVTGSVMIGAVLSVFLLYRDQDRVKPREAEATDTSRFWKRPEYLTTLLVLFFVTMADRTFGLTVPLFLEELGTTAAWVAGTVISIATFGEALSAWMSGKLVSRMTLRRLITIRLVMSIAVL